MARVTVEDCLLHVENRFKLVLLASKRARQLSLGAKPLVDAGKNKWTVLALREIAEGKLSEEVVNTVETQIVPVKIPEDIDFSD